LLKPFRENTLFAAIIICCRLLPFSRSFLSRIPIISESHLFDRKPYNWYLIFSQVENMD